MYTRVSYLRVRFLQWQESIVSGLEKEVQGRFGSRKSTTKWVLKMFKLFWDGF